MNIRAVLAVLLLAGCVNALADQTVSYGEYVKGLCQVNEIIKNEYNNTISSVIVPCNNCTGSFNVDSLQGISVTGWILGEELLAAGQFGFRATASLIPVGTYNLYMNCSNSDYLDGDIEDAKLTVTAEPTSPVSKEEDGWFLSGVKDAVEWFFGLIGVPFDLMVKVGGFIDAVFQFGAAILGYVGWAANQVYLMFSDPLLYFTETLPNLFLGFFWDVISLYFIWMIFLETMLIGYVIIAKKGLERDVFTLIYELFSVNLWFFTLFVTVFYRVVMGVVTIASKAWSALTGLVQSTPVA